MKILNLNKSFGNLKILENFCIGINSGTTCFFGPSGCGKTTLMNIIAGLVKKDSGEISKPMGDISYVFQDDRLLPWESALLNVAAVRKDMKSKKNLQESGELLRRMGINDIHKYPAQLSGGMRQRVNLARGLHFDSKLLILDEPFKGLDILLKKNLIYIIMKKSLEKQVLVITHDVEEALLISDEIVILDGPPLKILSRFSVERPKDITALELIEKYRNAFLIS